MKELRKLHENAAEQYELAAKHHRAAAHSLDEGDIDSASQHMCTAHGYAIHAHEFAADVFRRHVDLYDEEAESEGDEE